MAALSGVLTKEFEEPAQQAAFDLAFLLFKILERSLGRSFPVLSEERIQSAYEHNVAWLGGTEASAQSLLDTLDEGAQPSLTSYIMSVFYGGAGTVSPGREDVSAPGCWPVLPGGDTRREACPSSVREPPPKRPKRDQEGGTAGLDFLGLPWRGSSPLALGGRFVIDRSPVRVRAPAPAESTRQTGR